MFGLFGPFIVVIAVIVMLVASVLAVIAAVAAVVIGTLILLFLISSVELSAAMLVWTGYCLRKPETRLRGALMFIAGAFGALLVMIEMLISAFFFHSLRDASPWILLAAPGFGFGWPALGVAFPFFLLDVLRLIIRKPQPSLQQDVKPESQTPSDSVTSVH
jgi:hypothetical protein